MGDLPSEEQLRRSKLSPEEVKFQELLRDIENRSLTNDRVIAALLMRIEHLEGLKSAADGWCWALDSATNFVQSVRNDLLPGETAAQALNLVDEWLDAAFACEPSPPEEPTGRRPAQEVLELGAAPARGEHKKQRRRTNGKNQKLVIAFLQQPEFRGGASKERVIQHLVSNGVQKTGAYAPIDRLIADGRVVQCGTVLYLYAR